MTTLLLVVAAAATSVTAAVVGPSPLVGAWTLASAVQVRSDGSAHQLAFVDSPDTTTGLLVYSADGTVSVQIVGHPRPVMTRTDAVVDPERTVSLARSYYAYYGRYQVDPIRHRIVHHVRESLWPSENGTTYGRTYTLAGDRLTVNSDPQLVDGERVINRLTWVRVRP